MKMWYNNYICELRGEEVAVAINSAGIFGIDGYKVLVECEFSGGLPGHSVVGLPSASVSEAIERVRSAIKNIKYDYPVSRITINLAPADRKKEGTVYDLPILVAVLARSNQIRKPYDKMAFVGELSLSGNVRPVSGVLSMALALKEQGITDFFVPFDNAKEASFCKDINIYAVKDVGEVLDHINGINLILPYKNDEKLQETWEFVDFSDVVGQENVKRALEISACGMHNVLLSGSPGSGKSMMAKRLTTILPKLTYDEQIEVIRINSAAGFTKNAIEISKNRPFRSPHHTSSAVALIGGIGSNKFPKPGEISLSHNGVLFLDELPEFSKDAIDALRAPLEDKKVTISRVNMSVTYPSDFVLIGAMNPCKCGYLGEDRCTCSENSVLRYSEKISGPMMDRMDVYVNVTSVKYEDLNERKKGESSAEISKRVANAREIQQKRFCGTNIKYNSGITPDKMKEFCPLEKDAEILLESAFKRLNMSARSYDKLVKVARTIADLDGEDTIKSHHILEAIQYRK